ncbi:MAG: DUF11 domain-containing protein, partial [Armatimonadetes bacterium]|nr:DUF11 domain-containing protein [Armatimonadota bacterium]
NRALVEIKSAKRKFDLEVMKVAYNKYGTQLTLGDSVQVGDSVTYKVTVTNKGPDTAKGIEILDSLRPVNDGSATFAMSQGSVTTNHDSSLMMLQLNWKLGDLSKDAFAILDVKTDAFFDGNLSNLAQISLTGDGEDPQPANDVASADVTVKKPDQDSDNVSNDVENGASNSGDGNNDGVQDSNQQNVTSLPNGVDQKYLTLESPGTTKLQQVKTLANPAPAQTPTGVQFPIGFVQFTVTSLALGSGTTVTVYLPDGVTLNSYWKYGPTPDNPVPHFYQFTYDGTTGAQVQGNKVVLHFVDGQRGDADLTANGQITDPGSPSLLDPVKSPGILGLTAFGIAADTGVVTPANLGVPSDARLAAWDAPNNRYLIDAEVTQLRPGQGMWLKTSSSTFLTLPAQPAGEAFQIPLELGWNLISFPFTSPVVWDLQALRVKRGSDEMALAQAQQTGITEDFAWAFQQSTTDPDTGQYVLVYDGSLLPNVLTQVEPFRACWVKALEPCSLVAAPPPAATITSAARSRSRRSRKVNWMVTLTAQTGASVQSVYLGLATDRVGGRKISRPPQAPGAAAGELSLLDASASGANLLGADLRPSLPAKGTWRLVMRGVPVDQEVTLTWPDLGHTPKNLAFHLVDEATGQRQYMRTTSRYVFRLNHRSEQRQLRVEVNQANVSSGRLSATLSTIGTRSFGAQFALVLSQPATVEARLMSPTGRVVAIVAQNMEGRRGLNALEWQGRSSTGVPLPRGVYLIEMVARTEEGQETRVVRSVRVR